MAGKESNNKIMTYFYAITSRLYGGQKWVEKNEIENLETFREAWCSASRGTP